MSNLSLNEVIDTMNDQGAYIWRLSIVKGRVHQPVGFQDDPQLDAAKSTEALTKMVNRFNPATNFFIELRQKPSQHGDKVIKLDFNKDGSSAEPQSGNHGLSGMPPEYMGLYGPQMLMNQHQELTQEKTRLEILKDDLAEKRTNLIIAQNQLEQDKKAFQETKSETVKQLQELEKKYSSKSEAVKNGVSILLEKVITELGKGEGKGLLGWFGEGEKEGLAGAEEARTPEEQAIEELAAMIYEFKPTVAEIKAIHNSIHNLLTNKAQSAS